MLSALDLSLMGIPEPVRKMPVKTLIEKYNGDIIKAAENLEKQEKVEAAPAPKKKKAVSPRTPNIPQIPKRSTPTSTQRIPKSPKK